MNSISFLNYVMIFPSDNHRMIARKFMRRSTDFTVHVSRYVDEVGAFFVA